MSEIFLVDFNKDTRSRKKNIINYLEAKNYIIHRLETWPDFIKALFKPKLVTILLLGIGRNQILLFLCALSFRKSVIIRLGGDPVSDKKEKLHNEKRFFHKMLLIIESYIWRELIKHPTEIFTVSYYMAEQLTRKYSIEKQKISVIYPIIKNHKIKSKSRKKSSQEANLVKGYCLGNFSFPSKRLAISNFINEVGKEANHSNNNFSLQLDIYGYDSKKLNTHMKTVLETPSKITVNLIGSVDSHSKIAGYDFFFYISNYDSFGLTIAEASLMGLETFCNNHPPFIEISKIYKNITILEAKNEANDFLFKVRSLIDRSAIPGEA